MNRLPVADSSPYKTCSKEDRSMRNEILKNRDSRMSQIWAMSFRAAALGMLMTMAMPVYAADRAVKSRVSPMYPEIAKRMKITGVVKMEVTIDADGKVTAVKTIEGNRMLSMAAEEAVHKWKYVPGDGAETVTVEMNFALAQ
jgi:TonB family protein